MPLRLAERHERRGSGRISRRCRSIAAGNGLFIRRESGRKLRRRGQHMAGNSLVDRFRIFRRPIIVGACAITARRRRSGAAIPTAGTAGARSGGPEGKQRRFLSLDEIGQLGAVLRDAGEEGIQSRLGLAAIRFLLLTGLRRMEALALPWEWVDTRSRCIRFGDTKSGAQLRPIGSAAISLLDTLPRSGASRFIFPAARDEGHFIGLPRVLARTCRRASLSGVTVC
jgi:integrase